VVRKTEQITKEDETMSISIQTNVTSLFAQENLATNTAFQSQTIQRLTSGYRINSSGDDAAGLAVANQFRSNIAELSQGVRNANDGTSILQIVDGGLSNISKILDRLKTLATESATTTFSGDRNVLNNEFTTLLTEIDRQAANIGLSGAGGNASLYNTSIATYIGGGDSQADAQVTIDLSGATNQVDSSGLALNSSAVDTSANALAALTAINTAVASLGTVQGKVGTGENLLQYASSLASSQITNFSAAQSRLRDADIAAEAANLTKAQTLQQSSIAALAQANAAPSAILKLLQ
jgi:flagellin